MNNDKYAIWTEIQKLATQYDWAVEGGQQEGELTRDQARKVRELLLGSLKELDKENA